MNNNKFSFFHSPFQIVSVRFYYFCVLCNFNQSTMYIIEYVIDHKPRIKMITHFQLCSRKCSSRTGLIKIKTLVSNYKQRNSLFLNSSPFFSWPFNLIHIIPLLTHPHPTSLNAFLFNYNIISHLTRLFH